MVSCRLYICLLAILPVLNATEDVSFYLSSKSEKFGNLQLHYKDIETHIPKESPIVFLLHGWSQNRTAKLYDLLKTAYLFRPDKNFYVIEVEYAQAAAKLYPLSVRAVPRIGEIIAEFIINMTDKGIPLQNIHLCGHSLGGQVVGFAGKAFLKKEHKKLPFIVALDPAGPLFQEGFVSKSNRLNKHDAQVVVVIHTDSTKWGTALACGTINIFPNGGEAFQPGCPNSARGEICLSHHKSYEYYAYAIAHPMTLMATECSSYSAFLAGTCKTNRQIDIGADLSHEDEGYYFISTNAEEPYEIPEKS